MYVNMYVYKLISYFIWTRLNQVFIFLISKAKFKNNFLTNN